MLKAPFQYCGGKSAVASLVWQRFGNPENYVEPFFGSGAVLLARPNVGNYEIVNDVDCLLTNFWRAVQAVPEKVAFHADWPVNELDLQAREISCLNAKPLIAEYMLRDPQYYDARIAGWWVHGMSCKIGGMYASGKGPWNVQNGELVKVQVGVTLQAPKCVPGSINGVAAIGQGGINRQMPLLAHEQGISAIRNNGGYEAIFQRMSALSKRLANVKVVCGDWSRIVKPSCTTQIGLTGVFLDPPYTFENREAVYAHDQDISAEVRDWAISNGDNPLLRIAYCGYEDGFEWPNTWVCVPWKANGGMSNKRKGGNNGNNRRERIWFSAHCLKAGLFDDH